MLENDLFKLFVRVQDVPDFPSLMQIPQATPAPWTLQPQLQLPLLQQSSSLILFPSTLPFYQDNTDSTRPLFREEVDMLDRIEVEEEDEHDRFMRVFGQMMELREKFKEILKGYSGLSNAHEQGRNATKKWENYGQQFLTVCIRGQTSEMQDARCEMAGEIKVES
ncbi:hypothetical protein PM082_024918 [Marasmius tenuissimus]|nr:hypothetical protein PM082_024918 [Marasmius tenuissimus]